MPISGRTAPASTPKVPVRVSAAIAFLTSNLEIPNCRAIAEGLTPDLRAARTAFNLPLVSETAGSFACSDGLVVRLHHLLPTLPKGTHCILRLRYSSSGNLPNESHH
jgi:hypothetical protein